MSFYRVVSLGYEQRSIEEVIDLLKSQDIHKLVDIRVFPLSRKKGFSKKALAARLESEGIAYVHLRQAGNPYYKERFDLERCLILYKEYLENNLELIELIATEIVGEPTALLCYERKHQDCHRSILLQAIEHYYPLKIIKFE